MRPLDGIDLPSLGIGNRPRFSRQRSERGGGVEAETRAGVRVGERQRRCVQQEARRGGPAVETIADDRRAQPDGAVDAELVGAAGVRLEHQPRATVDAGLDLPARDRRLGYTVLARRLIARRPGRDVVCLRVMPSTAMQLDQADGSELIFLDHEERGGLDE